MAANPITITLVDGITKGLKDISNGVNGLGAQFVKLNAGIELVQQSFGLIVDAAQGLGSLVQPAADLEDALAAVQAVTGATAEEFTKLKAASEDAAARTRFTAVEAAGGLAELARAGLTATDAIEALNPALNLAQGNAIQVSESAQLLTTSLVQFGLATDEASRVADVLQKTADGTSTSVTELGLALGYAAPGAKSLGLSIEETAAAIGIMAKNGLRGERAGTVLREVFAQLQTPTSALAKAMAAAGVETGSFSGFLAALGNDGALAQKAMTALGVTGQALRPLIADAGKSIVDFTEVLRDADGAAANTAATMGATLNTALAKLSNAFEQVKITLFEPLLEPLRVELESAAKEIVAFTKTVEFTELSERIKEFTLIGVESIREFVKEFDFTAAVTGLNQFVSDASASLADLKTTFDTVKLTIASLDGAFYAASAAVNSVQSAFASLKVVLQAYAELQAGAVGIVAKALGVGTEAIDDFAQSMRDAAEVSKEQAGKNLAELAGDLDGLAGAALRAGEGLGGMSQKAAETATVTADLAAKTKETNAAIDEFALLGAAAFKRLTDDSAKALRDLQIELALAFSSKKTLEEAEVLRDGLVTIFKQIGLDVGIVEQAFAKFSDKLTNEDLGKKAAEAFAGVKDALDALNAGANDAQQKFNAALEGLFKGRTAEDAAILRSQVVAELTGMGASIDQVERLMANFNAQLEKAAQSTAVANLADEFELLGIKSKSELDKLAKGAETAFDTIVKAVRSANGPIEDIRAAFIAYAKTQLDAVKNADELKRAQVLAALESKAAAAGLSESLVELGVVGKDAGEKAAKAVKSIAPAADDATKSAQNLSGALAGAGSSAASAAGSIQGNTSALVTNTGAAQENAYYVGETSKALADQFRAASFSAEGINQLNRVLLQQNQEAARYVELLREQIALTDPVEKSLERLRNKFRGLGDETLRTIAQLEQQRDRARGTETGAAGEETTTTTTTGAAAPGRANVVVNLSLSALDPAQLDAAVLNDLARKLTGPLRQFALSSS